jgi:glycosyltransferase involved in cell wall biosynthesis
MPFEPSVSVIIPTYNRANFVLNAIQSVLDQTLKDVEIIVVDDGSTDDTQHALGPFNKKIRYLLTENKGASHARNIGMKAALGRYIAFLDSDDTYLPSKLELQVSFMESHPEIGMTFTEVSATDGKCVFERYHLRSFHSIYDRKGWSYQDVFQGKGEFHCGAFRDSVPYYTGNVFKPVLMGPLVFSNTVLFPRTILQHVGYQNESYRYCEDYEFVVRICKHYKVAFLNVPTYLYRYHPDQISKVNQPRTKQKIMAEIELEKVITQAILDWGYKDSDYYALNRDWLDRQLAEQYLCQGEHWLDYGDSRKARECFKKGQAFDPTMRDNQKMLVFSLLPKIVRRILSGVAGRLKT